MSDARLPAIRRRYAREIMTASREAGFDDPRVEDAFATVARERYLKPPPWRIFAPGGLMDAETADPTRLYADVLVVLDRARGINNGQPSLHASWLVAVGPQAGETVVQIGAGTGYYTAILAELVGEGSRVEAYEIEADLADLARHHLADRPQVQVHGRSGIGDLPAADVIYVAAGAAAPPTGWLESLKPKGRLVFPWQPGPDRGMTLLIRRDARGFSARPLFPVSFVGCVGADFRTLRMRGMPARPYEATRSVWLRAGREPDETATAIYEHVWLSAADP